MDEQTKNLILAFALSLAVIMGWFALFPPPSPVPQTTIAPGELLPPPASETAGADAPIAEPLAQTLRIAIDTPRLVGTIAATGGRIDDLQLRDYRETLAETSDPVHLLNPAGGARHPYYALYGWSPSGALDYAQVPGPSTAWSQVGGNALTPQTPVTLRWDNGAGLIFTRVIAVDTDFLFTVTQSVENNSSAAVTLRPYSILAQHGVPADLQGYYISHEGLVQQTDGTLLETKYGDMTDFAVSDRERTPTHETEATRSGWIGFTSKYFMAALVAPPGQPVTSVAQYVPGAEIYQASLRQPAMTVEPGQSASAQSMLFTGAKEYATLSAYQADLGIERFVDAIDWGWFFFLTKPIFQLLNFYNGMIGNMGWAILALTLTLKAVLLPLAWKSYVSMARMKELQPEMLKIKERAGEDRQKLQQEMMALYRERKVNPAAGCLPILLQIPIFFSLYKVIFVTIELRHAPWLWVFNDLSSPDPTSIMNLFGALPLDGPVPGSLLATIFLGLLPLLFGASMWFQMRLNPMPTDPMQATIFNWMPWIFMFVMGGFASGLLIYWIGNNIITFVQQYLIMSAHGSRPDIFGNIRASVVRPKSTKAK